MGENMGFGALGASPGDPGMGGLGPMPGYPQQFQPAQQPQIDAFQSNQAYTAGREMEVVSAKLDAIKATLESISQRLASMERYQQTEQDFKRRGGQW